MRPAANLRWSIWPFELSVLVQACTTIFYCPVKVEKGRPVQDAATIVRVSSKSPSSRRACWCLYARQRNRTRFSTTSSLSSWIERFRISFFRSRLRLARASSSRIRTNSSISASSPESSELLLSAAAAVEHQTREASASLHLFWCTYFGYTIRVYLFSSTPIFWPYQGFPTQGYI